MKNALPSICLCLLVGCDPPKAPTPEPPPATSGRIEVEPPTVNEVDTRPSPQPWRIAGTLVGTTETHAVVETKEGLVSVDIESGAISDPATTHGEDPQPSFLNHLPRLGSDEAPHVEVDRVAGTPAYVGGGAVIFFRGADKATTSIVGLDAATLELLWGKPLAYDEPVSTCATHAGVVIVPPPPAPTRAVDWKGEQLWLREVIPYGEQLAEFRCSPQRLVVTLEGGAKATYDGRTGDLLTEPMPESVVPPTSVVRQEGGEVVYDGE